MFVVVFQGIIKSKILTPSRTGLVPLLFGALDPVVTSTILEEENLLPLFLFLYLRFRSLFLDFFSFLKKSKNKNDDQVKKKIIVSYLFI